MNIDRLLEAARNGEVLLVRYFGGSHPGSERQIRPITVAGDQVRALCLQSGETKSFVLAKLEEAVEGVPSKLAREVKVLPHTFPTALEFFGHYQEFLKEKGWAVKLEGNVLSLHRSRKNGQVLKTADVELSYEAETSDLVFDGEELRQENHRPRVRPWSVRAKGKTTKSFGDEGKAELLFLEWACELAPSGAQ